MRIAQLPPGVTFASYLLWLMRAGAVAALLLLAGAAWQVTRVDWLVAAPGLLVALVWAGAEWQAAYGRRLARAWRKSVAARRRSVEADDNPVNLFSTALAETWKRQILTSQEHGNAAVLTISRDFEAMHHQLNDSLRMTRQFGESLGANNDGGVVQRSADALREVLTSMADAQAEKNRLTDAINSVVTATTEMRAQTLGIQKIARETKIIALNAHIESARAGEFGKAFAVVAQRVSELSELTNEAASKVVARMDALHGAVGEARFRADLVSANEQLLLEDAEYRIVEVANGLSGILKRLESILAELDQKSMTVQSHVSSAITELQFQDRNSQILQHVVDSIEQMRALMTTTGHWPHASQLQRLGETLFLSYSMLQERALHDAEGRPVEQQAEEEDDVTFF